MRLTAEELSRLNDALATLRRSLKDEIQSIPERHLPAASRARINMDDAFLKTIGENYLSGAHGAPGLVGLLLDSGILTSGNDCVCGFTCSTPTAWNGGCPSFVCSPSSPH